MDNRIPRINFLNTPILWPQKAKLLSTSSTGLDGWKMLHVILGRGIVERMDDNGKRTTMHPEEEK